MIIKFKLFEAEFRNTLDPKNIEKLFDPNKYDQILKILNYNKSDFKDGKFLEDIFIHKPFHKRIELIWNHTIGIHNFKERIRDRTQCRSIDEFNDLIREIIKYLFVENKFRGTGFTKYGLHLSESKLDFTISFNHYDLKYPKFRMEIRTVGYKPTDCEIVYIDEFDFYLKKLSNN